MEHLPNWKVFEIASECSHRRWSIECRR